jgi:hypothetical protein
MTRTADHQASHRSANSAQRPPRAPEPAEAVVLTPEGKRQLAVRAARLATELIPRVAHYYLDTLTRTGGPAWSTGRP